MSSHAFNDRDSPIELSRPVIERRLSDHLARRPLSDPETSSRRAAVAALLRFDRGAPDVLLMKRAERADDRWSGHVSLPGGGEDAVDRDLQGTAMRETLEEVGVDLAATATPIGRLAHIRASAKGRIVPMVITPFIFAQTAPAEIALGHEAQDAFWLPLDRAVRGEFDDEYPYRIGPITKRLPCWRYQDFIVWGLTYGILGDLLRVVGALR